MTFDVSMAFSSYKTSTSAATQRQTKTQVCYPKKWTSTKPGNKKIKHDKTNPNKNNLVVLTSKTVGDFPSRFFCWFPRGRVPHIQGKAEGPGSDEGALGPEDHQKKNNERNEPRVEPHVFFNFKLFIMFNPTAFQLFVCYFKLCCFMVHLLMFDPRKCWHMFLKINLQSSGWSDHWKLHIPSFPNHWGRALLSRRKPNSISIWEPEY